MNKYFIYLAHAIHEVAIQINNNNLLPSKRYSLPRVCYNYYKDFVTIISDVDNAELIETTNKS